MKINLSTRKSKLTILLVVFFVFAVSGGYLLWRINQPETVAPEDTEAITYDCNRCSRSFKYARAKWNFPKIEDLEDWQKNLIDTECGGTLDCDCSVNVFWGQIPGGVTYECDENCTTGTGISWEGYESCAREIEVPVEDTYYNCARCSNTYKYAYARWRVPEEYKTLCERAVEENILLPNGDEMGKNVTYNCNTSCTGGQITGWDSSTKWVDGRNYLNIVGDNPSYEECASTLDSEPEPYIPPPRTTSYTVMYDGNGGTCTPSSRQVTTGGSASGPSCSRTGYTLSNFNVSVGRCAGTFTASTGACSSVTSNMTIQANWTVKTYTLNYSPGSNGTLDGNTSQTVNHGSSGTPVTAIPNEGYNFGGWDDGKTSNPRTDSNVSKSINVTAIFSLTCGNGTCEPELGENALNCPVDCSGVCGDGYCTHDETNQTCPEDCPADCGDAYCDPETETVANCPADCDPVCGDGYCTHDETSETCPEDCGPSATGPTDVTSVPETGIFDDSQTSILVGFGLLILGFTWRFVGRGMYSLLGNAPRKISIHLKDMREERSLRRSRKRKQKFEDKVVKD